MDKKEIAITFLNLAGTGKVQEAFDRYVSSDFIHHNQYFHGSGESLIRAMKDDHSKQPNSSIEVKHSYLDGNTVITNSHVVKNDMEIAVIHIFRFNDDNKIAEAWDLGQVILKDSPNENGLF